MQEITKGLQSFLAAFASRYPGESGRRQPVHTVYGGAHLFKSDTAPRLGALASRAFETYAPDAQTFAEHDSLSVQHTLYAMGEAVLEKFPDIAEIAFSLPNIHYLPVDLARLGLENGNQIFLPTDEPHGLIEARLSR